MVNITDSRQFCFRISIQETCLRAVASIEQIFVSLIYLIESIFAFALKIAVTYEASLCNRFSLSSLDIRLSRRLLAPGFSCSVGLHRKCIN